jgi:hypothetical protein
MSPVGSSRYVEKPSRRGITEVYALVYGEREEKLESEGERVFYASIYSLAGRKLQLGT